MLLAIDYPNITVPGIFNIFKTTIENYSTDADHIEDMINWINKKHSGRSVADISKSPADVKQNYHSTFIFRNFYRMIDQSDNWKDALKSGALEKKMSSLKEQIVKKLKHNYRDTILLDKFEIVCEFIDLVRKRAASLNDSK